jgi:hypothetical protein
MRYHVSGLGELHLEAPRVTGRAYPAYAWSTVLATWLLARLGNSGAGIFMLLLEEDAFLRHMSSSVIRQANMLGRSEILSF